MTSRSVKLVRNGDGASLITKTGYLKCVPVFVSEEIRGRLKIHKNQKRVLLLHCEISHTLVYFFFYMILIKFGL